MINEKAVRKELKALKLPSDTIDIVVHNLTELVGIVVHNIPRDYKPSSQPLQDLKSIVVHN